MSRPFPLAAITDEFSPDLETALGAMVELGMTAAELRMVFDKNIINLTDEELDRAIGIVKSRGLEIVSVASPLLKCVLPGAPEVDARFQQDVFAAVLTIEDQPRLAARAFEIAARSGARVIRVFSYWRSVEPEQCFGRIVDALGELAEQGRRQGVIIAIENEQACNISTGEEAARVLRAVNHPNLKVVWDPANARVSGEARPFPDGYRRLPPDSIAHVHAKDVAVDGLKVDWRQIGDGEIDWAGQLRALAEDGYEGYISLETHWPGPGGDKLLASVMSGRRLKALVAAA